MGVKNATDKTWEEVIIPTSSQAGEERPASARQSLLCDRNRGRQLLFRQFAWRKIG